MKTRALFVLALGLLLSVPGLAQKKKVVQHRVVFQLTTSDTAAYRALTRQIGNVLTHWPTAKIEVVVHNRGIGFMRKDQSVLEAEIQAFTDKGVVFAVCENTLKQQKLSKDQILPQAIFVPVGLAEIITRQEEGWAYIKAGF
jgi:intracellular sulfur oxidation DsrE/DsrF family protein